MECYSLLESYGHVVYENKKSFEKKNPEKYFFEWWKNFDQIFLHIFFENPLNLENGDFEKKNVKISRPKIFHHSKKYFSGTFFSKTFLFS